MERRAKHGSLGWPLRRTNRLRVYIERRTQRRMSHQFLHYFELNTETSEQSAISMAERVPSDSFVDAQLFGN